jgi:siroheme synthase
MGRDTIAEIAKKLIKAGRDPSTPVAVIEKGTMKDERILTGKLSSIAEVVETANVEGPVLIVVGEVVKMAEILNHKKI